MSFDPVWEQIHKERPWGKYPKEELVRWVARNYFKAADRWQLKFLDLGCGAGANTWFLRHEGFDAVGIDGSQSAIARMTGSGTVGDVVNLPFDDCTFDCVVDIACIAHNSLQDAKKIVAGISRVLKPTGKVFSLMPSDDCSRIPYDGKGTVIFLTMGGVIDLFSPHFHTKINWTQFSDDSYTVKHWLISGNKIGA